MKKPRVKFRILYTFFCIFILFSTFFLLSDSKILFGKIGVKAEYEVTGGAFQYANKSEIGTWGQTSSEGQPEIGYITKKDLDYYQVQDLTPPYYYRWLMTWDYSKNITDSYSYEEYGMEMPVWNTSNAENVSITQMYAVIEFKVSYPHNAGNISVCTDYPSTGVLAYINPRSYGNWTVYNTTYSDGITTFEGGLGTFHNREMWDITDLHEWNLYDIYSSGSLRVLWSSIENSSNNYVNYVGIYWVGVYHNSYWFPDIEMDSQLYGLIWLLVTFLPSIALSIYAPKLGAYMGLIIMLLILGFTQDDFEANMIMGMITCGIGIYKSW